MKLRATLLASLLVLAAGCPKSKGAETADPCKDKKMPMFEGPLAAGQWESLGADDRKEFMEHVVVPAMKGHFQGFDAEEFAEFGCKTCHGAGADEGGDYEMPNPDLPVLTMDTFTDPPEEDHAILEFMGGTVKPEMARLLGLPEKTQTTEGFGCMECHTMAEQ